MKYLSTIILLSVLCVSSVNANSESSLDSKVNSAPIKSEVHFKSKDNVQLYGDLYQVTEGKSAPIIMLFHQGGGDARGEYANLIPDILQHGYNVMAVDLRSGGNRFGSENRTVNKLDGVKYSYCDAYPDLEATLDYVLQAGFSGKKIAWGSSFSAALVFQLASKRSSDLSAILAFSPASGGPMAPCKPDLFVNALKTPVLVLRPATEMQRETSIKQFEFFKSLGIQTYIALNGVHGSSMLDNSRVEGSVTAHWEKVFTFIKNNSEL
jgi:alpha-beta hydrolase superfamily lysophospholipase